MPAIAVLLWAHPLTARVLEVDVTGIVHPVTVEIVSSAISQAEAEHDSAIIIRLSTPGGIIDSTREIVESIFHSKVPVITWVGPSGARAASAGFFLLEAGSTAAMAPGTNTGASHPVSSTGANLESVMNEKVENDTAALIRTIAAQRGRNVAVAEKAVRSSVSWTDREALDQHLIDIEAPDPVSLLKSLHYTDTTIEQFQPSMRQRILSAIADPNIALLLLVFGALGMYAEFSIPGAVFPGVGGAILVLLGLAALAMFPIAWLGATLIILGLAFFVMEAKFATHGILTGGGAIAMLLGALMLIDTNDPALKIHLSTALSVTIPFALITSFLLSIAVRARRNKVVTGLEAMPGRCGVAVGELNPSGKVLIQGEYWNAIAATPIHAAERVRVTGVDGLTLKVSSEE